MVVKCMTITLRIPWSKSLKDKRMVVKSLLDKTSGKFNISTAEVECQDNHKMATLAFVCVAAEAALADSIIEHTLCFIENHCEAEITGITHEYR